MKNIFVGNLDFNTSEEELRKLFEAHGQVDRVSIMTDRDTGRSISETMWVSRKALAASRGEAAAVRVETVQSTGALIRAVEEYDLVFSTARIGGV